MRIKALFNESDPRQESYIRFLKRAFPELISEDDPEMYYVIGGDGAMLHANKNAPNKSIPFFGKGFGTLNFIMNNFDSDYQIIESLLEYKIKPDIIQTQKINVEIIKPHTNINKITISCINDVVIGGDIMDYNKFKISSEDKSFSDLIIDGAGLCVSTPLGSTAFNLNNKGAVLPMEGKVWSFTSIACTRNINEVIFPQDIVIEVLSERSNPFIYVDGRANQLELECGDTFVISPSKDQFSIAFLDITEFNQKRIKMIQKRR